MMIAVLRGQGFARSSGVGVLPKEIVRAQHPALWTYLEEGQAHSVDRRYLSRHRTPWYAQEKRPAPPFLLTYMGRRDPGKTRPFRFILNHSRATAANVYLLLYPRPALAHRMSEDPGLASRIWEALNEIPPETLVGEGRVYGGGLHKLEPKELGRVPAWALGDLLASDALDAGVPVAQQMSFLAQV